MSEGLDRLILSAEWRFFHGSSESLDQDGWLTLDSSAVLMVTDGLVRVLGPGGGTTTDLAPGDALLLPTGVRHRVHALAEAQVLVAHLATQVPPTTAEWLPDRIVLTDLARYEPLAGELLRDIVANASERPANAICDRASTLLASMMLRSWLERGCAPDRWLLQVDDPDVARAVSAIHDDPGRDWTVESLARIALASRTHFAGRFRRAVGITPLRYVTTARMELARLMLRREEYPIAVVAARVGYGSTAAFGRAFVRHDGRTPQQWRDQARTSAGRRDGSASETRNSTAPTTAATAAIR